MQGQLTEPKPQDLEKLVAALGPELSPTAAVSFDLTDMTDRVKLRHTGKMLE